MRISFRLIGSLVLAISVISVLFAIFQVNTEKRSKRNELSRRAEIIAESLRESVELLPPKGSEKRLRQIVEKFGSPELLAGVVIYNKDGKPILVTSDLGKRLGSKLPPVQNGVLQGKTVGRFFNAGQTEWHAYYVPLHTGEQISGALAVFNDATYIEAQTAKTWRDTFTRVLVQVLVIAGITLLVIRWSMVRPITRMAQWMRDLRAGKTVPQPGLIGEDVLRPLTQEVTHMATSLRRARASAQEEARLREAAESLWTAERLRVFLQGTLEGRKFCVVSNREPYQQFYRGSSIETIVPASGLVTAMEPILVASDGTWIAHGAGDADRATVDERDRLRVPPGDPRYTLRRVWLNRQEEDGYYYGFANEGLWPLCHIAHTRPVFRAEDFRYYKEVNSKFADAVIEEVGDVQNPIILVQDYHFALLPRLIKEKRPDARVAIFWHIPWPNPEAFGICPWQHELLDGLLGADLIGFHIESHCRNFLETVDRALESRIAWERMNVTRGSHLTMVRPFPISVEPQDAPDETHERESVFLERAELLRELNIEADFVGIGVDRLDYTKGIPERFHGVERFLERHPNYCGRFTFVQIAAPTRTRINRYQDIIAEVESEAERINRRFQTRRWKPIILLARHHSHKEIARYYRAADVCMVTSLHDGMNLVAKEFVASRVDGGGAVILSRFAGAAQELLDALIVNPYDTEQLAEAIRMALELTPEERRGRMRTMRRVVKEGNIYRWAADLIGAVSGIRLDMPEIVKSPADARTQASGQAR
ncbi:MAG: trehalose 6-phosphate synthase/phosphatase [Bryobacterales bacterium]|nr:trehalose 6-phosphate synthase/phosphatase [Bryobacterales bacterium]